MEALRNKIYPLPSQFQVKEPPTYCKTINCKHHSNCRNGKHPSTRKCQSIINRSNGNRSCGFFIYDEFKISAVTDPEFTLSCRYEPTRDLLVSPSKHQTNREISITTSFWGYILNIYLFLKQQPKATDNPVENIALNFGKWETANPLDSSFYALDCHAHAHISLTSTMFNVLERLDTFLPLR